MNQNLLDDSLRCYQCKCFAQHAVESLCDCHMLYCEQCSLLVHQCELCGKNFRPKNLEHEDFNPQASNLFDQSEYFAPSRLARKLLSSLHLTCEEPGCNTTYTLDTFEEHRRKCIYRDYVCRLCNDMLFLSLSED